MGVRREPAALAQGPQISRHRGRVDVIGRVGEHHIEFARPGSLQHRSHSPHPHFRAGQPEVGDIAATIAAAARSDSISSACTAPRDSASRPSAPDPHRGRHADTVEVDPGVQRAEQRPRAPRSEVGLVPAGGTRSRRPPAVPATIRVIRPLTRAPLVRPAVAALDLLDTADRDPADGAGARRGDRGLHLHRLDGAMVSPAAIESPSDTASVTTPANGAAMWPGLDLSAFSAAGSRWRWTGHGPATGRADR